EIPPEVLEAGAVLGLGVRENPAVVVKIESGLCQGQVRVFRGLGLGATEAVAHGLGQVAHLGQHAELPVGDIVQPYAGREAVVAQVAATLVEQGLGHRNQGCGSAHSGNLAAVGIGGEDGVGV